jgi:hypothetical protein
VRANVGDVLDVARNFPAVVGRHDARALCMDELRELSRRGTAHELGSRIFALAGQLTFVEMAGATGLPEAHVRSIFAEFSAHDAMCRANAAAHRRRQHAIV